MKKTPWFPANVTPVRAGLYQTRLHEASLVTWSLWNGLKWSAASEDVEWVISEGVAHGASFWQMREWRGLAEAI